MDNVNKELIEENVINKIKGIFDPEIPVNIYDLGLIYDILFIEKPDGLDCEVTMTLTSVGCPVGEMLQMDVQNEVESLDDIDNCKVEVVFEPPWETFKITDEGKEILALSGVNLPGL